MAEAKLFAGARIRRIRMGLEKTQAAFAADLGISPSYLNLIERNGRPLTAQLLVKLAAIGVDIAELHGEGDAAAVADLRRVFADPLMEGELPGETELVEWAQVAPNAVRGVAKLHRAYTETRERLSELSSTLEVETGGPLLPIDIVREAFAARPYCFPLVEAKVDELLEALGEPEDLYVSLRDWLRRERGISVQVLPADTMPLWRRRFDRHSRRLFLSERLSRPKQVETVAQEVVALVAREAIDEELALMRCDEGEAGRLAARELARYGALAVLMPYDRALDTAERVAWDVERVAARFSLTFAQAARRLTALQDGSRGRRRGLPVFLMEVDHAGNVVRRQGSSGSGGAGFPTAAFGGECVRLPVFHAFAEPGRTLVEMVENPAGERFLLVARTADGPRGGFGERVRRTAYLLGFRGEDADATAYAAALPRDVPPTGIGPTCRLCEREGCLSRAHPPVSRPAAPDPARQGIGPYDFG